MLDEKLVLMVNLSRLIAVSEYLRERGDEHVSAVIDKVVNGFQDILSNLRKK